MPTFIDMSALTLKSSASGQEEIQVSESNKINTSQIAALTFAQNPNMGDLPINSRLKYVDNKTTLLGMLKMLTAAANIGRLRIVSGNPATGASGKPEMAFIVNIIQGTNAETQGTNGLQIFHLTNDYIRVIPSSSVAMAWPTLQTLTDEAIITKLHSTASGDWGGLGMKLPWTGGSIKPIRVEDFTMINEIWPAGLTPGTTVPFYTEGEMYSAPLTADSSYVGQVIIDGNFATWGTATVIAYGNMTRRMRCGKLDFNGQSIDWYPSPVGTLTLSTFTNLTSNANVGGMNIGEMLGFYSSNGGSTSGPGASPLFGYIQKTSSSQVNIFAYTIDGKKSWLGYYAGSNAIWTPVSGASGGNVIHGEDITEGLEYLVPENVGDVVAFRSTMDSSQVPAGQEGFGFLAKVNGSESMAMMMQNDPAGGGKMKFFMGRVQNDGSGTDWQELTTGSSGVKKLPGLDVALNESTGVITYTSTELVPLSAGTTLLLCFELADSDARFSPCGNVVVYYDLHPANNLWGTIAGFFDNATSSNGFINVRRRGAGIIDFQCLSALVDGYPSLQVYLKHILILG